MDTYQPPIPAGGRIPQGQPMHHQQQGGYPQAQGMSHPDTPGNYIHQDVGEEGISEQTLYMLHQEYGDDFARTREQTPNNYAKCLKCWGSCFESCCSALGATGDSSCVKIIQPGYVGIVSELGIVKRKVGPGPQFFNPCTEEIEIYDNRRKILTLSGQRLLTRDNLVLNCMAYCTYDYYNLEIAYYKVQDIKNFIRYTIQGILKGLIAERTLTSLQKNTIEINKACLNETSRKLAPFGVRVTSMEIRNIQLLRSMVRAMAVAAESKQENEQRKNAAMGYLKSAKAYSKAAESYRGHETALQLNYYEMLKGMATGKKSGATIMIRDSMIDFDSL